MNKTPTPHNNAILGDFAKTVLMPGDPKRSEYIAKNFLTNPVLVNDVRGVKGFTGTYKGERVSVMAHGMGMPSISIYSYELFNFYGVENIIRVGSCGGINEKVELMDVLIADPAVTNENIGRNANYENKKINYPSGKLVSLAETKAKELGIAVKKGKVVSSDIFYDLSDEGKRWKEEGALAVEMEAFALYMNADQAKKNALCLLTVSDLIYDQSKCLSAQERQTSFDDMIKLALEIAIEK